MVVGIDVGSTTVKAVVLDPITLEILWSDYQRHQTKQPEKVLELIDAIEAAFPSSPRDKWRVFMTGSGAAPLCAGLGAKFVQEVNAVTLAVENLHPDVGSVIELGGQDAKIIIFKKDEKTGDKTAAPSMNDKCASGTGATIDKCMIKVGLPPEEVREDPLRRLEAAPRRRQVRRLRRDRHREPGEERHPRDRGALLARRRHRPPEPLGADPRVDAEAQGAPARRAEHLPALPPGVLAPPHPPDLGRARLRLAQGPARRGDHLRPRERAVLRGVRRLRVRPQEAAGVGVYEGKAGLVEYMTNGRKARLGESAGPPLAKTRDEITDFKELYSIPRSSR